MSPDAVTVWMCITASFPTSHPTNVSSKNTTALVLPYFPFCENLGLVTPGHARCGARTGPRSLCRCGKQSRVPSYREGPWTNATISEFLPLALHNVGLGLSFFFSSFHRAFWAGPVEWPCRLLSVLCLNQQVQDHLQPPPEACQGCPPSVPAAC